MKLFLLVYDRKTGKLLQQREYRGDDRAQALLDRTAREMEEREKPDIEVVLLAADSLDALMRTHSRYFKSREELQTAASR